jgi:hypothetical protein
MANKEFAFDLVLMSVARVHAATEEEARQKLNEVVEAVDLNFEQDGVKLTEASIYDKDGIELFEIDGAGSGEIDYIATAKSYGFEVTSRDYFEKVVDCPVGLIERARAYVGTHVMWDPSDDVDGFLLVGDDPEALAKDWHDGRPDEVRRIYKAKVEAPPAARDYRITVRRIIHEDAVVTVKAASIEEARHQAELEATSLDQEKWEGSECMYTSDDDEAE